MSTIQAQPLPRPGTRGTTPLRPASLRTWHEPPGAAVVQFLERVRQGRDLPVLVDDVAAAPQPVGHA